jgi:hypothetical protein
VELLVETKERIIHHGRLSLPLPFSFHYFLKKLGLSVSRLFSTVPSCVTPLLPDDDWVETAR